MTTLQSKLNTRRRERLGVEAGPVAQAEALERLVTLLEGETLHAPHKDESTDPLSQMARLRAARAAYALASNGSMERVSTGAFIRRRQPTTGAREWSEWAVVAER